MVLNADLKSARATHSWLTDNTLPLETPFKERYGKLELFSVNNGVSKLSSWIKMSQLSPELLRSVQSLRGASKWSARMCPLCPTVITTILSNDNLRKIDSTPMKYSPYAAFQKYLMNLSIVCSPVTSVLDDHLEKPSASIFAIWLSGTCNSDRATLCA